MSTTASEIAVACTKMSTTASEIACNTPAILRHRVRELSLDGSQQDFWFKLPVLQMRKLEVQS